MWIWFDKKNPLASFSFSLSRVCDGKEKVFYSPSIRLIRKKIENVLSNEAMSANTFDVLEQLRAFPQNPELDGDETRTMMATRRGLKFMKESVASPHIFHTSFSFSVPAEATRAGYSGWEKVLSSSPPEPRKHERVLDGERPSRRGAWKALSTKRRDMCSGWKARFLMRINLWKSVHAWWFLIFIP